MGTDIHLRVQKISDGKWVFADGLADTIDYDKEYPRRWYSTRNYDLFAMLADVRNGYGFAGYYIGDGLVPISDPRGIPDDLGVAYEDPWDAGLGDHSQSWLTVRELVDYDWSQVTMRGGVLSMREYARLKMVQQWHEFPQPEEWSASIYGPGIEIISNEEMERRIGDTHWHDIPEDTYGMLSRYYTHTKWPVMYSQAAGEFYVFTMPRLIKLARENGGLDNVRIVFGFDS